MSAALEERQRLVRRVALLADLMADVTADELRTLDRAAVILGRALDRSAQL